MLWVEAVNQMQPVYMYKYSINFTQLILLNSALKVQIGGVGRTWPWSGLLL